MLADEVANVLQVLRGAFRTKLEADTALVWAQLLKDVEYRHGMEVAELYARTEKFFPKPAEFLAGVHELQRKDELAHMAEQNTTTSYRCDGSRWRCAEHHGKCPIDCTVAAGMEPCPTCNGHTYDRLSTEAGNHKWRSGGKFNDDSVVVGPACIPLHDTPARPTQPPAELRDSDWLTTRKDLA